MLFPEYECYDGLGLAELVRKKEVAPADLVEAAIERIEQHNPALNAVVCRMYDEARQRAKGELPDGPFHGAPFLLKDLTSSYAGIPLTSGSRIYQQWRPPRHSELVKRFLASGVIVLGKTNTPEFGLMPVTEPELFGPTRNPWRLERTPGGSSGGTAAAVAARFVPLGGGGDGGGSIRIPASCCGLLGLKPSRGLNPVGPDVGEYWQGLAVEHVITRSVRDSAAMLDATAGAEPGGHHHALYPTRPLLEQIRRPPGSLRIAYSADPYLPCGEVHPDCKAALEETVRLLAELGHELMEARPSLDGEALARALLTMVAGETWADVLEAERKTGRKATSRDFEDVTWMLRTLGRTYSAGEFAAAVRRIKRVGFEIAAFMQGHAADILLSPTLASPPIPIGAILPRGFNAQMQRFLGRLGLGALMRAFAVLEHAAQGAFAFAPYTPVFNATGQPSMSVPLCWNAEGLPIGLLFTGRYGEDANLLRLAAQLEEARPWKDRKPPVCGEN